MRGRTWLDQGVSTRYGKILGTASCPPRERNMGSGLSTAIPALFIIFLTVPLGGLTLVTAWAKIFIEQGSSRWNAPKSLHAFTAAVIIESITLPVTWVIPNDLRPTILMLFLITSFALMITSLALRGQSSWSGKGIVRVGLMVVFAVNVTGLIGIVLGLPGGPLH
jgi:hypothetical protein